MIAEHPFALKRVLTESLKFLSAAEVLRTSSTCRFWHSLCQEDELWLVLLGEEGNRYRQSLTPTPSLQEAFRLMHKFVYVFSGKNLLRYAVSTGKWVSKPLLISGKIGKEPVITHVNDVQLFACGGSSTTLDAFFVDVTTGVATIAQKMRVHRVYPGVCRYDQHIYCFAGDFVNHRKICDRIGIDTGKWEKLPNCLSSRHAFNPVVVRPVIYLPNGCCSTVEVFDVASSTFTMLSIDTKQTSSSGNLFHNGELVILGIRKAFLWKPGDPEGRSVAYPKELDAAWTSHDPVVHAGEVILLWANADRWKICFIDLTTFQSRVIAIPKN